jgi:hypothetical protein
MGRGRAAGRGACSCACAMPEPDPAQGQQVIIGVDVDQHRLMPCIAQKLGPAMCLRARPGPRSPYHPAPTGSRAAARSRSPPTLCGGPRLPQRGPGYRPAPVRAAGSRRAGVWSFLHDRGHLAVIEHSRVRLLAGRHAATAAIPTTAPAIVHLTTQSAAITGHHQEQKSWSMRSNHYAQLVGLGPRTR